MSMLVCLRKKSWRHSNRSKYIKTYKRNTRIKVMWYLCGIVTKVRQMTCCNTSGLCIVAAKLSHELVLEDASKYFIINIHLTSGTAAVKGVACFAKLNRFWSMYIYDDASENYYFIHINMGINVIWFWLLVTLCIKPNLYMECKNLRFCTASTVEGEQAKAMKSTNKIFVGMMKNLWMHAWIMTEI